MKSPEVQGDPQLGSREHRSSGSLWGLTHLVARGLNNLASPLGNQLCACIPALPPPPQTACPSTPGWDFLGCTQTGTQACCSHGPELAPLLGQWSQILMKSIPVNGPVSNSFILATIHTQSSPCCETRLLARGPLHLPGTGVRALHIISGHPHNKGRILVSPL